MGVRDMGWTLLPAIQELDKPYMTVDFDPQAVDRLQEAEVPVMFGDAGNEDLLSDIRAHKAKMIVSTIPDSHVGADLLRYLKHKRFRGTVIVTAKGREDAMELYQLGATFVIVPSVLGGEHFIELLKRKKMQKRYWKATKRVA